jgi:hypothetical protein
MLFLLLNTPKRKGILLKDSFSPLLVLSPTRSFKTETDMDVIEFFGHKTNEG